jgi:hypothetical protein
MRQIVSNLVQTYQLTSMSKVILTKDDLGAIINAMDVVYNLMDDRHTATLKMEGSKETGTF